MTERIDYPPVDPTLLGEPTEIGETTMSLIEEAWLIIANASGGNWGFENPEWREAAAKWRDRYFESLTSKE